MIGYHAACFIGAQTVQDLLVDQANARLINSIKEAVKSRGSTLADLDSSCLGAAGNVVHCFTDIMITSLCCHADTVRVLTR